MTGVTWRRGWDLNPRSCQPRQRLSRAPHSASLAPLRGADDRSGPPAVAPPAEMGQTEPLCPRLPSSPWARSRSATCVGRGRAATPCSTTSRSGSAIGDHVALVGANGVGKTTLLRIIGGDLAGATARSPWMASLAVMPQLVGLDPGRHHHPAAPALVRAHGRSAKSAAASPRRRPPTRPGRRPRRRSRLRPGHQRLGRGRRLRHRGPVGHGDHQGARSAIRGSPVSGRLHLLGRRAEASGAGGAPVGRSRRPAARRARQLPRRRRASDGWRTS